MLHNKRLRVMARVKRPEAAMSHIPGPTPYSLLVGNESAAKIAWTVY